MQKIKVFKKEEHLIIKIWSLHKNQMIFNKKKI